MKIAKCWMLSVVSLTTLLVVDMPQVAAQDELPPPSPDGPALNAADGNQSEYPPAAPPVVIPIPRENRSVAPQRDTAAPQPVANHQAYFGITLDPSIRGAAVAQAVAPRSPAEQAGLQPGDTIEAINGRRVSSYDDVLEFIDALQPGDRVDIDYSRRIRVRTQAVLDGRPAEERPAARLAPNRDVEMARYDAAIPQQLEQLPPPPGFEARPQPDAQQYIRPRRPYNREALQRYDARRDDTRRADADREQSSRENRRGLFDRRNRDRPLLPWRRN